MDSEEKWKIEMQADGGKARVKTWSRNCRVSQQRDGETAPISRASSSCPDTTSTVVHPGPWGSEEVGMGVGVEVVELLLLLGQDAQVLLDFPSPTHCSVPEI